MLPKGRVVRLGDSVRAETGGVGKLVDERASVHSASRKKGTARAGEINDEDLFEPSRAKGTPNPKASHFKDVIAQMLTDHADRPKTRVLLQIVARMLGLTIARCLSNIILYVTGCAWLEARRDYAVLPPEAKIVTATGEPLKVDGAELTVQKFAERFKPKMFTISEDQAIDENMKAVEIRYEVLPPREGKNSYSIIYYVRREREHMPIPLVGVLLDLIRPLLWATKSEWNAIEIDVDRNTGEPESLNYESTNYTADPLSYEITSTNDVHLPVKVALRDKKWTHTLYQKNNRGKSREIENPFQGDTRPSFTFVNWNGGLDLVNAAQLSGYKASAEPSSKTRLYSMSDLPMRFLDIQTYRKEAIDLRNEWLKRRQTGHCYLYFGARKEPGEFRVINLVSDELPSLLASRTV